MGSTPSRGTIFMEKNKTLSTSITNKAISLTYVSISFLCFVIPFLLGHPQILVGTIVNAGLFLAALFLPQLMVYSLVFFPSLAVLSRGIIFGPLTSFLFLMIPFIWLGNFLLVSVFKKILAIKESYWLAAIAASLVKFLFLFSISLLLFRLKILPQAFITTMGIFQLITALLGSLVAFIIKKFYYARI